MIAKAPLQDYLLFFRSTVWDKGISQSELDAIMARLDAWFDDLAARGLTDGGMRLSVDGRVVRCHQGRFLSDGPFVESKEAVAGCIHVRACDLDEAVALARTWPGLECGLTVEVRPVVPACPLEREPKAEP